MAILWFHVSAILLKLMLKILIIENMTINLHERFLSSEPLDAIRGCLLGKSL